MKWMIASDIHGSAKYCRMLLDAYKAQGAQRLLLLGDLLYHGPRNPLPEGYDPMAVAALLNAHKDEITALHGNCDSEVDQMVLDFPIETEFCLIPIGAHTIFAAHGHKHNLDAPPALRKGDYLLHGHTHEQVWQPHQGITYVNPGSVSIPKGQSVRGYLLLTDEAFLYKALDGSTIMTRNIP